MPTAGRYQRGPVTEDGVRRDFHDHVIIRGRLSIHIPGGLWMADMIHDAADPSLQQYLITAKRLLKRYFTKAGWGGVGDIRVCDLGADPAREVTFHRATFFAQDVMGKLIFVSLPKDRADAALARLGIAEDVDEIG